MSSLRWLPLLLALAVLTTWEMTVRAGLLPAVFFPPPSLVLATLWRLIRTGEVLRQAGFTTLRLLAGFALGGAAGIGLGVALGWSPRLRLVIDPFVAALHPVPKVSLLPIVMIVLGVGVLSKLLVVAIAAFFPLVVNSMAGVRQIDPDYFAVARVYGAGPRRIFRQIVIPGSLPTVLAGARIAMATSLSLTIAVELITAENGLGAMIYFAWQTLRTEELFAAVLVIAALGFGFRALVSAASTALTPWHEPSTA